MNISSQTSAAILLPCEQTLGKTTIPNPKPVFKVSYTSNVLQIAVVTNM
jgi:hypothetical protein